MKPILKSTLSNDAEWESIQPAITESLSLIGELLSKVEYTYKDSVVMVKRKRHGSALEKKGRKGYQHYLECRDLVKGVVLTEDLDQVVWAANLINQSSNVCKLEVKTGNPSNPYKGAIHIDIKLGNLICEIQVMTKAAWEVKKESNPLYKQGKPELGKELWSQVQSFSSAQLCELCY